MQNQPFQTKLYIAIIRDPCMHPLDKFTKYLCKILDVVPKRNLLVLRNNALCITHHINQQNVL